MAHLRKEESNYGFLRNIVAKMQQGRPKNGWEDYTRMDINGKEWDFLDWIHLAWNGFQRRTVVKW
jgi:hypothetical protein